MSQYDEKNTFLDLKNNGIDIAPQFKRYYVGSQWFKTIPCRHFSDKEEALKHYNKSKESFDDIIYFDCGDLETLRKRYKVTELKQPSLI